jgi:D-alanyl-D-alanine carboxypeptidase
VLGPDTTALAAPTPTADRADRLQAVLDETVARGVPAIAARIETPDWTWTGIAGVASVESGAPLTEEHRFRLASVTTLFTEVVVLQMVDEGNLRRDDKLTDLLDQPVVAKIPHAQQITLEQLVRHESGIRSFTDVGRFFRAGAFEHATHFPRGP